MHRNHTIAPAALLLFLWCASAFPTEPARCIQQLDDGNRVVMVTLGTSLTGGRWRWVDGMKAWLEEAYPGQVTVHNLGVGASASQTVPAMKGNRYTWNRCGLDRVKEVAGLKPDVVFIEFGVNDAHEPYGISLEQSRANLESMIDQVLAGAPDCEVVLLTMNAVTGAGEQSRPNLAAYYQVVRDVAKERGLRLADGYPAWNAIKQDDPDRFKTLVPDGVHPRAPGYREVLLPIVKDALGAGRREIRKKD